MAPPQKRVATHGARPALPERREILEVVKRPDRLISGVIFVASFGFEHVWRSEADAVAPLLPTLDIEALSQRAVRRELAAFVETCDLIRDRIEVDQRTAPRWLLVLASKADLYWDAINTARGYYTGYEPDDLGAPAATSSGFVEELAALRSDIGNIFPFEQHVLPVVCDLKPFEFRSHRGEVLVEPQLGSPQARASLELIVDAIGELNGWELRDG